MIPISYCDGGQWKQGWLVSLLMDNMSSGSVRPVIAIQEDKGWGHDLGLTMKSGIALSAIRITRHRIPLIDPGTK